MSEDRLPAEWRTVVAKETELGKAIFQNEKVADRARAATSLFCLSRDGKAFSDSDVELKPTR